MPNSLGKAVDVDCECLCRLKGQMFEISARAGKAGNSQCGLDVADYKTAGALGPDTQTSGTEVIGMVMTQLEHGPNYIVIKQPKII
ncbi:hypothetical protein BDZ97DRAFT_1929649 [Flammula alnicola]|nr:hypothetical protein BDZ97DRAFT_1929649 [Flammula alnicola]